jgi:hypothetical protein
VRFVHEDPEFDELLRIVAAQRGLGIALVEKDYWVTHTLWALHHQGFQVWFKGGTSLSKGFALIQRFSEDLDLKIEPGTVAAVPSVADWKSEGKAATKARKEHFVALADQLRVPGAAISQGAQDGAFRYSNLHVEFPSAHRHELPAVLSPSVLLEIGSARVTPFVERDMTSFVHEHLATLGQLGEFEDNQPRAVRCVHPLVTLLEKLDSLHRRFPGETPPAKFVRHFEDAARIVAAAASLPALTSFASVKALAEELLDQKQLRKLPAAGDLSLQPGDSERWHAVRKAHEDIHPMFWGPRLTVDDACSRLREWLVREFP